MIVGARRGKALGSACAKHLGGAEAPGAQLPFGGVLVVATRSCGAAVENTTLVGVVSASRLMIQAERAKRASLLEVLSE